MQESINLIENLDALEFKRIENMRKTLKINDEITAALQENIEKINAQIRSYEDQMEELKATSAKLVEALSEVSPENRLRMKNIVDPEAGKFRERINAVKDAFGKVASKGRQGFTHKDIFMLVLETNPTLFRNNKRGKNIFSSMFWQVAKALLKKNKIIQIEKGAGRKATQFLRIDQ